MEIVAQRQFNALYIWLDVCFLVFFCALLFFNRRYMTLLFALAVNVVIGRKMRDIDMLGALKSVE